MKVTYFDDTDTLLIELAERRVEDTCDLDENTTIEYDSNGNPLSITIEHLSERIKQGQFIISDVEISQQKVVEEKYVEGTEAFRKRRLELEKEVRKDVKKSVFELATDVYDEVLREDRDVVENQNHALKRFSAIIAKFTLSSDELGEKTLILNRWIMGLTIILTFLTAMMLYKMLCP